MIQGYKGSADELKQDEDIIFETRQIMSTEWVKGLRKHVLQDQSRSRSFSLGIVS